MRKAPMRALYAICAAAFLAGAIAGCNDQNDAQPVAQVAPVVQPQTVYAAPAAPVYAAPVVVQQSGPGDFVSGMLVGHMLSGSHTTVVHHYSAPRVVVRNTYVRSYSRSYSYRRR